VRFEVMKHFGYYVSESPYHMSEYTPYFRKNKEMIEKWGVQDRWWLCSERNRDHNMDEMEATLAPGKEVPMEITPEYAPECIRALITGNIFRANLNVLNYGKIANLPDDCCVEVPCFVDSVGIHPCQVGNLPPGPCGLNLHEITVHNAMAKAAVKKEIRYIYDAVYLDPFTAAQCDLEQIKSMTSELIALNKDYLKEFK
jgi:alpha-galactosidase